MMNKNTVLAWATFIMIVVGCGLIALGAFRYDEVAGWGFASVGIGFSIARIGRLFLELPHGFNRQSTKTTGCNHHQIEEPETTEINLSRAVIDQHLEEKGDSGGNGATDEDRKVKVATSSPPKTTRLKDD